jgi:hypothetical protein
MNLTAGECTTFLAHRPGKSQFTPPRLRAFLFPSLPQLARLQGCAIIFATFCVQKALSAQLGPFRAWPTAAGRHIEDQGAHIACPAFAPSPHHLTTMPRMPRSLSIIKSECHCDCPHPPCCMQARYIDADPSQVNFNILALGPNIC